MSIATVVTRGYGSFGNIPFVVTRGYSIGLDIKWVTQSPDNTSYTIQAPDSTSYTTQTADATIWTTIPED